MMTNTNPHRIRSIAVHRDDVMTALEATLRTDRSVVLRVTPPFSGRMRARIHALSGAEQNTLEPAAVAGSADANAAPIIIPPETLVESVPEYPEVDDTIARAPGADIEARRQQHTAAIQTWRTTVQASIVEQVTFEPSGHTVDVLALG